MIMLEIWDDDERCCVFCCLWAYVHRHFCIYVHICIYIYIYIYTYTYICLCVYIYFYMYISSLIYIYLHIYINVYVHILIGNTTRNNLIINWSFQHYDVPSLRIGRNTFFLIRLQARLRVGREEERGAEDVALLPVLPRVRRTWERLSLLHNRTTDHLELHSGRHFIIWGGYS